MNKEQFLAMSLPFGLNGVVDGKSNVTGEFIYTLQSVHYNTEVVEVVGESDFHTEKFKPILHPLSDLTKEIEHKGEKFVPLEILCDIYGAKFDRPYINERSAGFVYGFSAKDVLNVKNMIENKFWQIHKLIEWHFDLFGGIDGGDAIDVNSLHENPYK